MIGQIISHYKITEKLGEGGMGAVYKAEDLKLGRAVALKFLPSQLLESEEHKARLIREARAAALLDHPNICTVYEIDEADERTFLAMACLEGQTLKQKIAERPLPLPEALEIAVQVGQGLQAAHDKGIVHRDIKPANIMITPQGQAKIMDFGLAQVSDYTRLTASGMKLGTPAYMSPEQTEGTPADSRVDLWALGVLLYEMVSGRVPFPGEAEAAVAYAILHTEPEPLTALRSGLPMELDRIVAKALAKRANDRYQHAADLLVDLRVMQRTLQKSGRVQSGPKAATGKPAAGWQARAGWLVALAAIMAALALLWNDWSTNLPEPPVIRFHFSIGPWVDAFSSVFWQPRVALSPDGSRIAFAANRDGIPRIYLRELSTDEAVSMPGTEGAHAPFFSPDGEWVAFFTSTQLKKVSVGSGAVLSICETIPVAIAGTWGLDDTILFSPSPGSPLSSVPASGGVPQPLTELAAGEKGQLFPAVLPGGRAVLYTIGRTLGVG